MIYLAFSDIHGCMDALYKGLKESGYDASNPNHHLLFLGDAFDKNLEDYKTYLFLKENLSNGRLTWILGNHDIYLLNCLEKKEYNQFSRTTIHNLAIGIDPNTEDEIETLLNAGVKELLLQGLYYFETPHYVFTHGVIPFDKKNHRYDPSWRDAPKSSWNLFQNSNGMKFALDGIKVPGKTLVVGHIGSYYGNLALRHPELVRDSEEFRKLGNKIKGSAKKYADYFEIFRGDGIIGIDCRCFDTGIAHVLVVED